MDIKNNLKVFWCLFLMLVGIFRAIFIKIISIPLFFVAIFMAIIAAIVRIFFEGIYGE
ncbi:MAG TPA: hypothetical protein VI911_11560 [Patescibacteria group bacterium]|nr:hypothetical protein [Patescibacteria group bacterium]